MPSSVKIARMSKQTQKPDFSARRKRFLKELGNSVALFPSANMSVRNSDVHYPFRQESNLYYLTGFWEPNSKVLLAGNSKAPFKMFVEPRDKRKELWEGAILGPERAKSHLGADEALSSSPSTLFDDAFVEAMTQADALYYRVGLDAEFDCHVFRLLDRARKKIGRSGRPVWPIHDPDEILGEMRLIKDAAEIESLSKGCEITAEAHRRCMQMARPGMFEHEIEAELYQYFRAHGAERLGYGSIVASGANACVLHYIENNKKMSAKDLLLIDAGAEYEYYSADITRTFPISGKFSEPQKAVYNAVLTAQLECIKAAKPGNSMKALHELATEVLIEELRKLKILKGTAKSIAKDKSYQEFYPHGTGHWLGMDVHDVGKYYVESYDTPRKLKPGMVFTIEPGLYFAPHSSAPAQYKGIGVRIEDDILITAKGCRVLTDKVPKSVEEVEALCQQPIE